MKFLLTTIAACAAIAACFRLAAREDPLEQVITTCRRGRFEAAVKQPDLSPDQHS